MSRSFTLAAAVALVGLLGADSLAQDFNLYRQPGGSGSRGYAGQELGNIRRSAIGIGYSVDQINTSTLRNSIAQPVRTGVASTDTASGQRGAASVASSLSPSSRQSQRPFSNIQRRPSVSPYMGLFREGFDDNANALNYQTLVRPQQRQQAFNRQVSREAAAINQRLQAIAAQPAYNPRGSQSLAPTGLQAGTFRYYSHFYGGR